MKKIAICVAETSGDLLAAQLITHIKTLYPKAEILGLIGEKSQQAGAVQIWDSRQVNVMGFIEVLKKLPQLLLLRRKIIRYFIKQKVDVFIGVDSPDFNFYIARKLKKQGIKTIHFVSPSIWAWRSERITKIKESIDVMLCLFPFEVELYTQHHIDAYFVGHPLAAFLPQRARYERCKKIVLMPGSRSSEIEYILPTMIKTAGNILRFDKEFEFHIPLAHASNSEFVESWVKGTDITYSVGDTYEHILDADLVVVASGTASLEVALIGTPQVVVYKMHPLSYRIARKKLTTRFVSLPNIILDKQVIIELLQDNYNQTTLAQAMFETLKHAEYQHQQFSALRDTLSGDLQQGIQAALEK